jgi:hypothetical protein
MSEQPRFRPIVDPPVRTERAIRARRTAERAQAIVDALKAHVAKKEATS